MKPDMLLPVFVGFLPASFFFGDDGKLRPKVKQLTTVGVVRVIAGPEQCHAVIDIKRPYYRPVGATL